VEGPRFVHREEGLFPAPMPQDSEGVGAIEARFKFLGNFLGKALLDGRLVSLPLAEPVYKVLCGYPIGVADLDKVDREKAKHLFGLLEAAEKGWPDISAYCLTFEYAPSSSSHGFEAHALIPGGSEVAVTNNNAHEYVERMACFMLRDGVARQFEALMAGFEEVVPASRLASFFPPELRLLLGGDAAVSWTREELQEHIQPRNGYDAQSRAFNDLLDVLSELSRKEKHDFLAFATGVRVLPAGGLKSLDPKLTVVRKHTDENPDEHFPSANTCFHFLKLPEYSSKDRLATQLRGALQHGFGGFFFN